MHENFFILSIVIIVLIVAVFGISTIIQTSSVDLSGQAKGGIKGSQDSSGSATQCNDCIDNDGDGFVDTGSCRIGRGRNSVQLPADLGCIDKNDDFEGDDSVCNNGITEQGELCDSNSRSCITSQGYPGIQACNLQCSGYLSCTSQEFCGDASCNGPENCSTCSRDCGQCPPPPSFCGDGSCDVDENCSICSSDCGSCPLPPSICGDSVCNGAETCSSCPTDCGVCGSLQAVVEVNEDPWYSARKASTYGGTELTDFYAPLPVFFEGWKSTPREEIVNYRWDFGDGSVLEGPGMFNSAHVYETPRPSEPYIATLTITNSQGQISSASIPIIVRARDGVIYYVDSQIGNDAYDGRCQTVSGSCGPWRTATYAFKGMGNQTTHGIYRPGDQILFKRGQKFDVNAKAFPGHGKAGYGYMFGAYGSGDKPIIRPIEDFTGVVLQFYSGLAHFTIEDITFMNADDGTRAGQLLELTEETSNILLLRVDAKKIRLLANINGKPGLYDSSDSNYNVISGFFLVDSNINDFSSFGIGLDAHRVAIIGNTISYGGNHNVYARFLNQGIFYDNSFIKGPFGREPFRISGELVLKNGSYSTDKLFATQHPSNNIYLGKNYFGGWIDPCATSSCEPTGNGHTGGGTRYLWTNIEIGPNVNAAQYIRDLVFEDNIVTNSETLMFFGDTENIMVRNNLFISNNQYDFSTGQAPDVIRIGDKHVSTDDIGFDSESGGGRATKNIKFLGNTFLLRRLPHSSVLRIDDWSQTSTDTHSGIEFKNNIIYIDGTGNMNLFRNDEPGSTLISDYNLFYNTGGTFGGPSGVAFDGVSFSVWQSQGQDVNSVIDQDPGFTTLTMGSAFWHTLSPGEWPGNLQALMSDINLTILGSSPAIDRGSNLGAYLYFDYTGKVRDNNKDIGAYEYS